jgi:hypothetical protein
MPHERLVKPARHAQLIALLFAAEAAFAIVHRAVGGEYRGFTHTHNVVIDVSLAVVWIGSALAALLHRGWPALFLTLVGASVSIVHGFMLSVALTDRGPYGVGVPFLLAAAVQLYLIVHAAPAFLEERAARAPARRVRPAWLLRLRHSH